MKSHTARKGVFSARSRGVLALLAIVGLTALALLVSQWQAKQALGSATERRLSHQAQMIHDNLVFQLQGVSEVMTRLQQRALQLQQQLTPWNVMVSDLKTLAQGVSGINVIALLDAQGRVQASSQEDLLGLAFPERDYFRRAQADPDPDRLLLSPPFRTVLGNYTLVLTKALVDADGIFRGIVTASINPAYFDTLLRSVLYADDMWAAIAHAEGLQLLMVPSRPGQQGLNLAQPGSFFTRHMDSGQMANVLSGQVYATGEERVMALRTIQPASLNLQPGLVVAIGRDLTALYADWRAENLRLGVGMGLFTLLLLGVMLFFSRRQGERDHYNKLLFDASSLPMGVIEQHTGRLRDLNPAARQLLGVGDEVRLAHNTLAAFAPQSQPEHRVSKQYLNRLLERARQSGFVSELWQCRNGQGEVRDCQLYMAPFQFNGEALLHFVLHDISEQRQVEAALIRARDLAEDASRAKGEFLANMSHEIRTPLNAVIGLIQLLRTMVLPEQANHYLDKMDASSRALLGLLNDILDYSKIESRSLELEQAPFNPATLVERVTDLCLAPAENAGLKVLVDVDAELPRSLIGDPLRLTQVLNNLLSNAIKFTPQGHVALRVRLRHETAESVEIEFSVSDTGIGMNAREQESLFQPFRQADSSITRRFGGSGLGLAISDQLVQLMGGELHCDSSPQRGSCFRFSLPLTVAHRQQGRPALPQLRDQGILIVERYAPSAEILADASRAWQMQPVLATSLEQAQQQVALAQQQGQRFALLFVDWDLAQGGVAPAYRALVALFKTQMERPVIIMAAASERTEVLREGGLPDAILTKPVTPSRLFDTLMDLYRPEVTALEQVDADRDWQTQAAPLAGGRILLVEDNATNQLVAQAMLEQMGLQVRVADNGERALELLQAEPFDLVLMDLQMPVMDGLEATRRIRALDSAVAQIPIVAMTAAATTQDREACVQAGMNDHVIKPIDAHRLVDRLLHWMPRRDEPVASQCAATEESDAAAPDATAPDATAREQDTSSAGLDFDLLLQRLGDRALCCRVLQQFETDLTPLLVRLEQALAAQDWPLAAQQAHGLKGMSANVAAHRLQQLALSLEQTLSGEAPSTAAQAQALAADLQAEAEAVRAQIAPQCGEPQA